MMTSLRKRLLWILMGLTLFAWIASALLTGLFATRVVMYQVDRQLEQYSDLVSYITQAFALQLEEGLPVVSEPWLSGHDNETNPSPVVIQGPTTKGLSPALNIWHSESEGGTLMAVLEDSPRFDRPTREGFSYVDKKVDDRYWRILARRDQHTGLWLVVGIELEEARWALMGIFGRALLPLLIVLPLTILLLYFGVSRGLRPLKVLAEQISRRNPKVLDPVVSEDAPAELQPVVFALNTLLQRLALALEGEQRFTANAAHELQTPLAAIKTEVQLCQRQLRDRGGREMLDRIALRVDRASHTVEQLLTLARLDPDLPIERSTIALRPLLQELLAETGHLAAQRGLHYKFEGEEELSLLGSEEALAILLRNLLTNVCRYAREQSEVTIATFLRDGRAVLEISNDCQPLAEDEFKRLTERFYRVPGSASLGAGLGLSIVQRIANTHSASFQATPRADDTGFCARLEFTAV